jgi:hypothetical protein
MFVWSHSDSEMWTALFIIVAVLLASGVWSVLRPARGPADLLAGTALVMR